MSLMENAQQYVANDGLAYVPTGDGGEVVMSPNPPEIKIGYAGPTSPAQTEARAGSSDIAKLYENLAPQAGGYANALSEQIGQAQRSMGPLAGRAMGQSQTAGLGNYTYNRLMRPQVDTMRDDILVKGYAEQLNQLLSDALNSAKRNYNKSRSGGGGNGGNGGTTGGQNSWQGDFENNPKDESNPPGSQYNPNDFVSGGYDFSNYGGLLGYTGKYPMTVDTPTKSTSYYEYTTNILDPQAKADTWYKYLKSIGYAG